MLAALPIPVPEISLRTPRRRCIAHFLLVDQQLKHARPAGSVQNPTSSRDRKIPDNLENDDDGAIEIESHEITLKCPLSLKRISVPAKGADCNHVQCFDLETWRIFAERAANTNRERRCPICNAHITSTVSDCNFQDLLNQTSDEILSVTVNKQWKIIDMKNKESSINKAKVEIVPSHPRSPKRYRKLISEKETSDRSNVIVID